MREGRVSSLEIQNMIFVIVLGFLFALSGCAGQLRVEPPPIPQEEKPEKIVRSEKPVAPEKLVKPFKPLPPANLEKPVKPKILAIPEKTEKQVLPLKPKGLSKSGNAWAFYDSMRLDFGDAQFLDVARNDQEILFQWGLKATGQSQYQAASIRNVGLFYYPKKNNNCLPDTIEILGLRSSYVLYFITQAYPEGPDGIPKPMSRTTQGKPAVIRFMNGTLEIKKDWKATVRVRRLGKKHFLFNVLVDDRPNPVLVDWKGDNPNNLLPDNEPLQDWLTCWHGIFSHHKNGSTKFKKTISETNRIKTFGDLRLLFSSSVFSD